MKLDRKNHEAVVADVLDRAVKMSLGSEAPIGTGKTIGGSEAPADKGKAIGGSEASADKGKKIGGSVAPVDNGRKRKLSYYVDFAGISSTPIIRK